MAISRESMEMGKNHLEVLKTLYGMILSGRRNEMEYVGVYVTNLTRNPLLGQYPYTLKSFEDSHIKDVNNVYNNLLEDNYSARDRDNDAATISRLIGNVEIEMGNSRISVKDFPSSNLPRTSTLGEELGFYASPSQILGRYSPEIDKPFLREEPAKRRPY